MTPRTAPPTEIDITDAATAAPAPAPLTGGPGVAYPAVPPGIALQLGALSIVLALLSAAEAKVFNPAALGIVVPVAFSVGAVAIFTGGLVNYRAGIQVAGLIGCLYGAFWLSVAVLLQLDAGPLVKAVGAGSFGHAFGAYLLIWAVMSAALCMPLLYVSKVILAQQALLAVVFVVLGIGAIAASSGTNQLGGVLGLLDAAACLYIALSQVTNDTAGRVVLPLP